VGTDERYYEWGWNDFVFSARKTYYFNSEQNTITGPVLRKWHRAGWYAAKTQAGAEGTMFYLNEALKYIESGSVDKTKIVVLLEKIRERLEIKEKPDLPDNVNQEVNTTIDILLKSLPVEATKVKKLTLQLILRRFMFRVLEIAKTTNIIKENENDRTGNESNRANSELDEANSDSDHEN
jgi:hypothetical protein